MPDSLWPHGLQPTRLLCQWDFPGKDAGVGCHFLLQGIFPTQGSNPGLLHCRQILYQLSYKGSPKNVIKKWMNEALMCRTHQFLWYKYSHHSLFQVTDDLKAGLQNSWMPNYLCPWANVSWLHHPLIAVSICPYHALGGSCLSVPMVHSRTHVSQSCTAILDCFFGSCSFETSCVKKYQTQSNPSWDRPTEM